MKKLLSLLLGLCLGLSACAAAWAEEAGTVVTGTIEDGCYVLTVKLDPADAGEWQADEMAQDQSVVKLAASGAEDGVFTARYEPTGDGDVSVALRHMSGHGVCDEMHTFDLRVKDGKVAEATGGSYTASPDEAEVDPYFSGEWREKDTQFTVLNAARKAEGGWEIEIMSPLSHGAWLIRATAYYDCDYDAFVYADGVKYDLLPDEEAPEKETANGLWGTLRFAGTEEDLQLEWYDMESMNGGTLLFDRADE